MNATAGEAYCIKIPDELNCQVGEARFENNGDQDVVKFSCDQCKESHQKIVTPD